jgi:hypothetical protein
VGRYGISFFCVTFFFEISKKWMAMASEALVIDVWYFEILLGGYQQNFLENDQKWILLN